MSNTRPTQDNNDQKVIELKDLIHILWPRKWLILACVIIALIIGAIVCKARIPLYQSNLLINISGSSNSGLMSSILGSASPMGAFGESSGAVATEQSIVTSRSVLEPTIQQLHLDVEASPAYFPIIGHKMALKYNTNNYTHQIAKPWLGMNSYDWGGSSLILNAFSVGPYWQGKSFQVIAQKNNTYLLMSPQGQKLAIGHVGSELSFNGDAYNSITLNIKSLIANPGTVFYLQQTAPQMALAQLSSKLVAAPTSQFASLLNVTLKGSNPEQMAVTLNTIGHYIVANSVKQTVMQATQTLEFLTSRIPATQQQLNIAETKLTEYRQQSGNIELPAQTKMLLGSLATTEAQLNQAKLAKTQLESQYVANSLPLQQITDSITQYQQQIDQLQKQLNNTPSADQTLVDLTRNATIQNAVYSNLLENIQKYELVKATTLGNVSIVDYADVPFAAIGASSKLIMVIALILGLIVGFIIAFIQHYLRRGIQDTDFIEHTLKLPVIATLFDSVEQRRQKRRFDKKLQPELELMSEIDPQSLVSESIRSLRTNVLFKLQAQKGNIITISGPTPSIGKSFVSANLAHALAEAGKRVLLIDADVRRGDLYHYFKGPHTPGLTDLLRGTVTADLCVQKTRFPQLDFLPTGSNTHDHTELLMAPSLQTAITTFSKQYDVVLIDTAPVLALTDATIIGQHAAVRLLVLGYGKHTEKQLEVTLSHFRKVNQSVDGCIFNLIPTKTNNAYGYGQQNYRYDYRSSKDKK